MLQNGDTLHAVNCRSAEVTNNDEQYDSEFEDTNENFGPHSQPSSAGSLKHINDSANTPTKSRPESIVNAGSVASRQRNGWHPKQIQQTNGYKSVIGKNGALRGNVALHRNAVDQWENAQMALAEAHSQNVLLQKQLQECRAELKTVQRQCKLQSARLNKAIGKEAELPRIVDRLTADVRSLQIRLREKTNQCEEGQRKIKELQHRILLLEKELEEKQNAVVPEDVVLKKQAHRIQELLTELDREKKKVVAMQRQLEVTSRSHKHHLGLAQERIRQLKRTCREMETQLGERTRLLQEKLKLLELQNIYCQRLPRHIPAQLPPTNVGPEQDMYKTSVETIVNTKTYQLPSSTIVDLEQCTGKNKVKLSFGRRKKFQSEVSNDTSKMNVQYAKEKHVNGLSEIMLCLNEIEYEEADAKTVESITDTSTVAPLTESVPASSGTFLEADQSVDADLEDKEPSADRSLTGKKTNAPYINCDADDYNRKAVTMQPQELRENIDLCSEKTKPNMPIDPNSDGFFVGQQEGSPTPQPSPRQRSAEAHERERKIRLLKAMEQFDCAKPSDAQTGKSRTVGDGSHANLTPQIKQAGEPEELKKLEQRREQQLWDELFGSKQPDVLNTKHDRSSDAHHQRHIGSKANSSNLNEHPQDSLARVKQEYHTKQSIFDSSPLTNRCIDIRRSNERLPSHSSTLSSNSVPTLPELVYTSEKHPKRMHPKYTQPRNFHDENDSEIEEFQA